MFKSSSMYGRLTSAVRGTGDIERNNSMAEVRLAALKEQLDRNERRGQARQLLINQLTGVAQHLYGNYEKIRAIRQGAGLMGAATAGGKGMILDLLFGPSNRDVYYGPGGRTYSSGDLLLLGNTNRQNPTYGAKMQRWMSKSTLFQDKSTVPPALDTLKPSVDMTQPVTDDEFGG